MDSKPALDPHQEHLDRLRDFGYNKQEARFLYLAATPFRILHTSPIPQLRPPNQGLSCSAVYD